MRDDYLWDRSGKPDPEVEKLEQALGRFAHRGEPLELPETLAPPELPEPAPRAGPRRLVELWDAWMSPRGGRSFGVPARAWSAAACLLVLAGALAWWTVAQRTPSWKVARLAGAPRVGQTHIVGTGRLAVGQWLETDAGSVAQVTIGRIGELLVEPNTRLRLDQAGGRAHRLRLEIGTVTAVILAPPGQFVVETPSARTVDLGCAYTLEVDAVGGALVTVLAGWVSFEHAGHESFIPAGARCATRPGSGPGTPYFTDASDGFKNALAAVDIAGDETSRAAALRTVLEEARREDGFTLWHLLARLDPRQRAAVYERLSALVPPPAGITRAGVIAGDQAMLDRWWNEFGYGEMKWWRLWQREWPRAGGRS